VKKKGSWGEGEKEGILPWTAKEGEVPMEKEKEWASREKKEKGRQGGGKIQTKRGVTVT